MTLVEERPASASEGLESTAVKIARRGARRLAKLTQPNGRFIYRYYGDTKRVYDQYNVLRHCGAVWSMFDVMRMTGADAEVKRAALRAARYMLANFARPFGEGDHLCIVDGDKIKLGGAGLALLALAEWNRVTPNPEVVDSARAIGRYILSQRTDDGDLHHGRTYPGGALYDFRSDYYTGEAIFGLIRLYEMTAEPVWLDAGFELLAALGPRDYGVAERSHWMLYALEAADAIRPLPENRDYAGRIAAGILSDPASYRGQGRSTPIACMSEALLAYMRLKRRQPSDTAAPTAAECQSAVIENLALQQQCLEPNGGFVERPGRRDVRIDYIQHNISSFAALGTLRAAALPLLRRSERSRVSPRRTGIPPR